jgi:ribosomal protein S18 acetylase RimI-like enzyme
MVERALFDYAEFWFRRNPHLAAIADVLDDRDVLRLVGDQNCSLSNGVYRARFPEPIAAERTQTVLAGYLQRGRPFEWLLTPSTRSSAMETVLTSHGMQADGPLIGMHTRLGIHTDWASVRRAETGHTIRPVTREADLDAAVGVLAAGFELSPTCQSVARAMTQPFVSASGQAMLSVLATDGGRPVGTGSVSVAGGVASLSNVTVLPAVRREGIGTAVTSALMGLGAEMGATDSVLLASPAGRYVNAPLGYRDICEVTVLTWAPPPPPGA